MSHICKDALTDLLIKNLSSPKGIKQREVLVSGFMTGLEELGEMVQELHLEEPVLRHRKDQRENDP